MKGGGQTSFCFGIVAGLEFGVLYGFFEQVSVRRPGSLCGSHILQNV